MVESMGGHEPATSTVWWCRNVTEISWDLAPATRRKLLGIISDPQKYTDLKIELAATIDVGEPFVKATYSLEGDGPLVLQCYEVVSSVNTSIESAHYPNLNAVALAIAPNDPSLSKS